MASCNVINSAEGFVKATSNNLPKINAFMTYDFFANDERLISTESQAWKASAATRESYDDNAVGYVQVNREGFICKAAASICPEH